MKKLNLASDELEVVPAVALVPPELDTPPLLEAPPEAEVPPVAPPLELLADDVPPELLLVLPPDLDDRLLALVPPEDALEPPELEVPPELEDPPELDLPPELLPPDELTLLLLLPPDDAPPEDDEDRLDALCPPLPLSLPLDPPELLLDPLCAVPVVSSASHPPRAGARINEEPNKIAHEGICFCFFKRIDNILPMHRTRRRVFAFEQSVWGRLRSFQKVYGVVKIGSLDTG